MMDLLKRQGRPVSSILPKKRFKSWHSVLLAASIFLFLPASSAQPAQVSLAWDASTDPCVAGFKVYFGNSSGSYQSVIDVGNTTTCTIANLLDGTPYYFVATDYNTSRSESGYSNEVSFTTPSSAQPAQVSLAWDASTDPSVAGFKVYYGNSSGSYQAVIYVGNTTTCTISGLLDGTTYYFAATDYNTSGSESGYSNEVSYTTYGACTCSILPSSQSAASSGDSGAVSVTASSGCPWTVVSNASWITITSNSSVTGNGTVTYSVSANSGTTSRSGTMTIAGETFTVTQYALTAK